jgi:hypothetical protein
MYAGMAVIGWGRLVQIAHNTAREEELLFVIVMRDRAVM